MPARIGPLQQGSTRIPYLTWTASCVAVGIAAPSGAAGTGEQADSTTGRSLKLSVEGLTARMNELHQTRKALEEIGSQGSKVRGRHDDIGSGPSPVSVTATDERTGMTYRIERRDGDEYEALIELARSLGLDIGQ